MPFVITRSFTTGKFDFVGITDVTSLHAGSSVEPDDAVVHLLPIFISLRVIADDVATYLCCSIGIIPDLLAIISLLLSEVAKVCGRAVGAHVECLIVGVAVF